MAFMHTHGRAIKICPFLILGAAWPPLFLSASLIVRRVREDRCQGIFNLLRKLEQVDAVIGLLAQSN